MKTLSVFLLVFALALTACAAPPAAPSPTATLATEILPSQPAVSPPALEGRYHDEQGRFTLAYPADWHQLGGESGLRGGYQQIASWDPGAAGIESIPNGESLLQIAEYVWDPKGDLAARIAMRHTALTSSGNTVLEEETVSLPSGPDAVRWLMQDSAGNQSLLYFFVLGDNYLEISGIGDLALLEQAIQTFEYLAQ